jgi:hypothetical protein
MWRHAAIVYAYRARVPHLDAATLALTIHLRNWRHADPQNYPSSSSVKGLIDGLKDARVITDDRPPYLRVEMPVLAALSARVAGRLPAIVATITEAGP